MLNVNIIQRIKIKLYKVLEWYFCDRLCIVRVAESVRDSESGKVSKRAKPVDPDAEDSRDNEDYYYEDVEERNNPTNEAPVVPPGFLSPSVREYLDLGKSIPGT